MKRLEPIKADDGKMVYFVQLLTLRNAFFEGVHEIITTKEKRSGE